MASHDRDFAEADVVQGRAMAVVGEAEKSGALLQVEVSDGNEQQERCSVQSGHRDHMRSTILGLGFGSGGYKRRIH